MGLSDKGKMGPDDEYPYEDHDDGHFEVHSPKWDSRTSWMSRDDSPPRHNGRPFEANHPDGGTRSTYTTYDDSPPNELMSHSSLDTKPNWLSRSESPPPGITIQSRLVSYPKPGTKPKWLSSRDDSPPRLKAHPNSGARPNWPIRNDSPPRAMEYYESHHNSNSRPNVAKARDNPPPRPIEYYESHPNSNTRLNWAKTRDDSPSKPIVIHLKPHTNLGANKPNWSSMQDYAPPRPIMHPELNHPNLDTRSIRPIQNESPPRIFENYESSHPKSNRPNWTKAQDDSPPKSMVQQPMAHPNSDDLMKVIEEAKITRANPIASQMPHSTTPSWSESTLIDNMEPKKRYEVLSSEDAERKYAGCSLFGGGGGGGGDGDCVINQHAIESMEARRRHPTQVERSPNTISRPTSGLLRWVVNRRNKRRQTIEANPKASN
nr:adhesive plaque matrix protein-like isoform X3 [Ipomoea batatas]